MYLLEISVCRSQHRYHLITRLELLLESDPPYFLYVLVRFHLFDDVEIRCSYHKWI